MADASHSAAPSAVGYQHQTWWALVELLRSGAERPDAAISLELFDDVAWDADGTPTELLQVKHHEGHSRTLTDRSVDWWKTLKVWMDTAVPGDITGPALVLVTTQVAKAGSAVSALRSQDRDEGGALQLLEVLAAEAGSEETRPARKQFMALQPSERRSLLNRVRILDGSPHVEDVPALVQACLHWTLPTGHEELFLAMVWRWWDAQALAMLQRRLTGLDVGVAQNAIADIRDQFTRESLPTLVELSDVDAGAVARDYGAYPFVQQMEWVDFPPRNLQKAIVDYYRAYTQTFRWLNEDLVGVAELTRFEDELVDEWEREFEWMVDGLSADADETDKKNAGKKLLRELLSKSGIVVRSRYNDPFFARGKRHMLADSGRMGWHADFESRIKVLLQVSV